MPKNNMKTFEEYLQDWHADAYSGTDDDMPEAYETWLSELDGEEYIRFADLYGKDCEIAGMKNAKELLYRVIDLSENQE